MMWSLAGRHSAGLLRYGPGNPGGHRRLGAHGTSSQTTAGLRPFGVGVMRAHRLCGGATGCKRRLAPKCSIPRCPVRRCSVGRRSVVRTAGNGEHRADLPHHRGSRRRQRAAGRILCSRIMAGKPVQRPRRKPERGGRNRAVHAAHCGFPRACRPFRCGDGVEHAAAYLHELRSQFGNLGLAAAGYNAGPGRVSAWLGGRRTLPSETRNYVAITTGWTADEWASPSPPKAAQTTIPQGVPCASLANLILAPPQEAQRIAAHVPRWGAQLTANTSESRAWAIYRALQKQYARLIGDREPMVLRGRVPGMGSAARTMIRIADDNRAPLDRLCRQLSAAGGAAWCCSTGSCTPPR